MNESYSEDIRDALDELRKYLSDALPPLLVVDSIQRLMAVEPELMIKEIVAWAETQCSFRGSAKLSDFLYHSLRKIHMIGEYQLISSADLDMYLNMLAPHLIAYCPSESRDALQSSIQRLSLLETGGRSIDRQAEVVYRIGTESTGQPKSTSPSSDSAQHPVSGQLPSQQAGLPGTVAAGGATRDTPGDSAYTGITTDFSRSMGKFGASHPAQDKSVQSFNQFLALLSEITAQSKAREEAAKEDNLPVPSWRDQREEITTQLFAAAARTAKTSQQLEEHLKQIRALGVDFNAIQAIQQLASSVPNYVILNKPDKVPGSQTSASTKSYADSRLQAVQKMIELAGSPAETSRRFKELIHTAVDQFNQGALGRAVAILDSARELISGGKTEKAAVEAVRQKGHEQVNFDRLVSCAGETTQKPLLHRFLTFFPALAPSGLLRQIKAEEERERRLALLSLMEVHGDEARQEILMELDKILQGEGQDLKDPQFFQRNLLTLLNRVPCSSDKMYDQEIDTLTQFAQSQLAKEVLRELIRNLGKYKDPKAENALIIVLHQVQNSINQLTLDKAPRFEIDDMTSLLDRVMSALAGFESRRTHKVVLDYCLPDNSEIRHNLAPLSALGEHNLSSDREAMLRLVKALTKELPSKIFGFLQNKDKALTLALVQALARTTAREAQNLLQKVAQRYPNTDFGQAAAKALEEFGSKSEKLPSPPSAEETPVLSGELRAFDLPTVLQYLETSSTTGIMSLTDQMGALCAKLSIENGKMKGCRAGRLKGAEAVYALLEKPILGRFVLTHPTAKDEEESASEGQPMALTWVLMEGVRRYDEYQQACLIIPDGAKLQPKAQNPPAVDDEKDEQLIKSVWSAVAAGLPPEGIENGLATDPYRVRRILTEWFYKGALGVVRAA